MTRARSGALLVVLVVASIAVPSVAATAQGKGSRAVLVVLADPVPFERLLALPEVAALASAGGAGLLANPDDVEPVATVPSSANVTSIRLDPSESAFGEELAGAVRAVDARQVLVIVTSDAPPSAAGAAGDELAPIVIAAGRPADLFEDPTEAGSVTSDSSRRDGVVTGGDVGATVRAFVAAERPDPEAAPGESIRIVPGPPPFELHERYVQQRRLRVPIGTAAAAAVSVAGLAGVALLSDRRPVPRQWRRIAGWAALSVPALATALLAVGHLPDLDYANVVPFVALVTVFGTLAFSPLERHDVGLVPAGIGIGVLGFFVAEAILGWPAMLTPLLGGSQLDGARFHGLPNVAVGLLIGASMWVAQRTSTSRGFLLVAALALLAGLPLVGSNLGGGISLFATAGLWVAVRERHRLGAARAIAVALAVTVAGTGLLLVAHAVSPVPTHVTRFERSGLDRAVGTLLDRLRVGFDLIARNPAALIPVVGLAVALLVVAKPPVLIRATFLRWPAWRDAVLVTLLGGVVAYVANDSGPAAAGLAFGLGLGGMVGMSLLWMPEKMEGS